MQYFNVINLNGIDTPILNKCDAITEQLGIKVGLSATEVQRRLREAVVIEADVSVVSPKAVCRNVTMLVFASLTRDRADIIDAFKEAIRVAPEIMSGYRITVALTG